MATSLQAGYPACADVCVLHCVAALSLPLLAVAVAVSPEPAGILAYPNMANQGFRVCAVCMQCPALHAPVLATAKTSQLRRDIARRHV